MKSNLIFSLIKRSTRNTKDRWSVVVSTDYNKKSNSTIYTKKISSKSNINIDENSSIIIDLLTPDEVENINSIIKEKYPKCKNITISLYVKLNGNDEEILFNIIKIKSNVLNDIKNTIKYALHLECN